MENTMTKEALQAQIDRAHKAVREIEDREWRELNKNIVGKCFKYHNSYGGDRPRWWLYAKVLKAKSKYECRCFEFATDCDGKHEIVPDVRMSPSFVGGGGNWIPVTLAEFNRQLDTLRRKIAAYKP